jgi:hypothetical protein
MVLTGSSNLLSILGNLASEILATGYTPVFKPTNSCTGVAAVMGPETAHVVSDSGKPAVYLQADGTTVPCLLGPNGATVDIGESDIFASSCSGFSEPGDDIGHYLGPVQTMVFVVPGASQQQAISAEAARAVFGMGGAGNSAAPWTNPDLYFVRNGNAGVQQLIGRAINVPPGSFWGTDRGSAQNVDSEMRDIADPTLANQAIGFISTDIYDGDRSNLAALAFQASGQECAYLPDSTPFKKDKRNVRDGHYPIWGPIHFFTSVTNGVPTSPAAAAFVSLVSVPNLAKPLVDSFIGASLVPTCAMAVQRDSEIGAVSSYAPPYQCGCYFEASVDGSAPPGCTPCNSPNDCTDPRRPACNLGYCEMQ